MEKYDTIEKNNGFHVTPVPANLHDKYDQLRLKDFAQRVMEELAEAASANSKVHLKEELADALHFMTELAILADVKPELGGTTKVSIPFDILAWQFATTLFMGCNCLKNKPWKVTHMLTDEPRYREYINQAFRELWILLLSYLGPEEEIYDYYYRKNQVNQFRVASAY